MVLSVLLNMSIRFSLSLYSNARAPTHTHTHTHLYIYRYVCVCVCLSMRMHIYTLRYLYIYMCVCVYKYIYMHMHHHHHHHVVLLARISLTLSRHFSLSFIAFGRSSGLHSVSSHSCCMYIRAGRPAFAWSYAGVHRSTSLMSSPLLLQQCPACLFRLTCIVFVMAV